MTEPLGYLVRFSHRIEPEFVVNKADAYRFPITDGRGLLVSVTPVIAAQDADKDRMDWLCMQCVTVRTPMRYGSKACFVGSPDDNDGETVPWDIRAAIDKARTTK